MLQPGGDLDLEQEALRPYRERELGREHLDRHRAGRVALPGEIDGRTAAVADLAVDDVAIG